MSTIDQLRAASRRREHQQRRPIAGRRERRPRHRIGVVRRLLRRRSLWLIVVVATSLLTIAAVRAEYERATALQRAWGDSVRVLVVTSPIEPGDVVGSHNTEPRAWPVSIAPPTARDQVQSGDRAVAAMSVGQPVLARDIGTLDEPGTLPHTRAAVGVPVGATTPFLQLGDIVDVHATFDPALGTDAATTVVAHRARVIALDDRIATMAVAIDEIDDVTRALVRASITVVIRER